MALLCCAGLGRLQAVPTVLLQEVFSREFSVFSGAQTSQIPSQVFSREFSVKVESDYYGKFGQTLSREISIVVPTPEVPASISQLKVVASPNGDTAYLDWSGYNELAQLDVIRYRIYESDQPILSLNGLTPISLVPAGSQSLIISNLLSWHDHYFVVVAEDALGGINSQIHYASAHVIANEVFSREFSISVGYDPSHLFPQVISRELSILQTTGAVPDPIAALSVGASPNGDSAKLDWSGYNELARSDIVRYDIYLSDSPFTSVNGMTPTTSIGAGTQQVEIRNLTPWKDHFFAVVPVDGLGQFPSSVHYAAAHVIASQLASREFSVFVAAELPGRYAQVLSREFDVLVPDDTVPEPVTGLGSSFTANTSTSAFSAVDLDWPGYNELKQVDVNRYRIYVGNEFFTDVSGLQPYEVIGAGRTHETVRGLLGGSLYYFAVVAEDLAGNFNTTVRARSAVTSIGALGEVLNLAVFSESNSIRFTWSPPPQKDAFLSRYHLYWDGATVPITLDSTATTYQATGLSAASVHHFQLTTIDLFGTESHGVTADAATWLPNPTNLLARGFDGQIRLTWTQAEPNAWIQSYAVYQLIDGATSVSGLTPLLTTRDPWANIGGLVNGSPVKLAVTTINLNGGEDPSVNPVTAIPVPPVAPFADLTLGGVTNPATAYGGQSMGVQWAVTNVGLAATTRLDGSVADHWVDRVILSPNNILGDADDMVLGGFSYLGVLAVGDTYIESGSVTLPVGLSGNFHLWVVANASGDVDEGLNRELDWNTPARVISVLPAKPPVILEPPLAASVLAGTPVTFSVVAKATPPISYQWKKDHDPISQANSATLKLPSTGLGDAGVYSVVVSNPAGQVESTPVELTVIRTQSIDFPQLGKVTFAPDLQVTLSAVATSGLPISYQMIDGPGTISGQVLLVRGAGSITVEAQQTGDGLTAPAIPVRQVLVVNKAIPTLSWNQPAPIPYGTPLSTSQLNATANVPGAFSYSPALGSILNEGTNQSLRVLFTTSDSTDYAPAEATVSITVLHTKSPDGCVSPISGIVSWWQGDGTPSDTVGGLTANVYGGATFGAGIVRGAFEFSRDGDFASVSSALAELPAGTVELWFNGSDWNWRSAPDGMYLWSGTRNAPPVGSSDVLSLGTHPRYSANGELLFGIYTGGWNWAHSGVTPQPGVWYHVAGTWGAGGIKIYINGELRGTNSYSGPLPNGIRHQVIGRSSWPLSNVHGLLDEVTLYDHALSGTELRAIYLARSSGKCLTAPPWDATPDLAVVSVAAPSAGVPGTSIDVACVITNRGGGSALGTWSDGVYLSASSTFDPATAILLGSVGMGHNVSAGGAYSWTNSVALPFDVQGPYYLFIVADDSVSGAGQQTIYETTKTNNTSFGAALNLIAPDMSPTSIQFPASALAGQPISIELTVTNQGTMDASIPWQNSFFLARDATGSDSRLLPSLPQAASVEMGMSDTSTRQIILPSDLSGLWYLGVTVDSQGQVFEFDKTNNTLVSPTPIQIGAPDLAVTLLSAVPSGVFGQTVTVTWAIQNIGTGPTFGPWSDQLYLSSSQNDLNGGSKLVRSSSIRPLAVGETYTNTVQVTLPFGRSFIPGSYFLVLQADDGNSLPESDESNNRASRNYALTLPALPDLLAFGLISAPSVTSGQTIPLTWTVTNQGFAAAVGPWLETVKLVPDAVWNVADEAQRKSRIAALPTLATFTASNSLAAGEFMVRTQRVTIPQNGPSGNLRFAVTVDARDDVFESNEANNQTTDGGIVQVPLSLSLQLSSPSVREDATVPIIATVTRNGDLNEAISVMVTNESPALLSYLPNTATSGATNLLIPAGESAVTFNLFPIPDHKVAPNRTVSISAAAVGYPVAAVSLTVLNVDLPNLTLTASTNSLIEGTILEVVATRDVVTPNDLVVTLASSNPRQLSPPGSVIIPAGMASTSFFVLAVDDLNAEAPATYSISAAAAGFNGGGLDLTVLDNDIPDLVVTLSPRTVSEGAGLQATSMTVTRNPVGAGALTIEPFASDPSLAITPIRITIPPGVASRSFPIGVVNDTLVNGNRTVTLGAYILAVGTGERLVEATPDALTVLDDDGPTLKLSATDKLVPEGRNPATLVTVTRNTPATSDLLVTLSSSDTNAASVPTSIVIPSGSTTATFPLVSIDDRTNSGNRSVVLTADAPGFTVGVESVVVSDIELPDLVVGNISVPDSATPQETVPISFQVANQGLSATSGNFLTRVYLSKDSVVGDDVLITQFRTATNLPVGSSIDISQPIQMPLDVGNYWLVVETDAEQVLAETLEDNNTLVSAHPIAVASDYAAWVQTDLTNAPAGTVVPLYGRATNGLGAPVSGKTVNVHILVRGTQRIISATTGNDGSFITTFTPLAGEAGHYDIFATHPGVAIASVQDSFSLLGFRANPESVSLTVIEGSSRSGTLSLENLSDVPLTGLAVQVLAKPANLSVNASLSSSQLSAQTALNYQFTANTTDAYGYVQLRVSTAEGLYKDIYFGVSVEPLRPRLVIEPDSLYSAMVLGKQAVVNFDVSNQGGRDTGPITVALPAVSWMRVASTNPLPSLAPGESNRVTLVLTPPIDLPLGPYTGSLAINAENSGANVPFNFRAMSEAIGDLRVDVVDEYTYYAEGGPHLAGAKVTVRDSVTQASVATGLTDTNGIFTVTNLNEAYYDIEVTADKHTSYRSTQLLKGGITNDVQAFISRQTVTYTWTVEPVQIDDQYRVAIETTFEGNVPAPVVTLSPSHIDLSSLVFVDGQASIELTLQNHGLIAAQNVSLNLPSHPIYNFVAPVTQIGVLSANSSLTIPVAVVDREYELEKQRDLKYVISKIPISLPSQSTNWQSIPALETIDGVLATKKHSSRRSIHTADDNVIPKDLPSWLYPKDGGCDDPGDAWKLWRKYDAADLLIYHIYAKLAMESLYTLRFGSQAVGLWEDYLDRRTGKTTFGDDDEVVTGTDYVNGFANCRVTRNVVEAVVDSAIGRILKQYRCDSIPSRVDLSDLFTPDEIRQFEALLEFVPWEGDIPAFLAGGGQGGGSANKHTCDSRKIRGYFMLIIRPSQCNGGINIEVVPKLEIEVFDSIDLVPGNDLSKWGKNVSWALGLGEMKVLEVNEWALAVPFSAKFHPKPPSKTFPMRCRPDCCTLSITAPYCYKCGPYLICGGATSVIDSTSDQNCQAASGPIWPQFTLTFPDISLPSISQWINLPSFTLPYLCSTVPIPSSVALGTPLIFRTDHKREPGILSEGNGVCARVKLRLEQEAVITRDAFRATIELDNSGSSRLENVKVDVTIRPEAGIADQSLFGVKLEGATTLSAVDGTGILPGNSTGTAKWLIVPTVDAAPTVDARYLVGGTLSYLLDGNQVSVPLSEVPITVLPTPRLVLQYFHQRDVFSDDPFTDEIEPSIPFSLGLMVQNRGYGTARNFRITSAQPQIVENLKGLLIDFNIVDTEVFNPSGISILNPALTANFGDLNPGDIGIGRWLMTSSLQGLFLDYKATVQHLDDLGNVRTSLIATNDVSIHEMIHLVQAGGIWEDGQPDFLVNDLPDFHDYPDTLYMSNGSTNSVQLVEQADVSADVSPENLEVTLSAGMPGQWAYLRVPDPGHGEFHLTRVVRSDGMVVPVNTNVWTTDRTFIGLGKRPIRENILHLLDYNSSGRYTLTYSPGPVPIVDTNPPISHVAALPSLSPAYFVVQWKGSDEGTGIASYDIWVSDNGGPFSPWLKGTTLNGVTYQGQANHTYSFYSIAVDVAGNREAAPSVPDATTTVDNLGFAGATISPIADRSTFVNAAVDGIVVNITDPGVSEDQWLLSVDSSNPSLISVASITWAGSGATRTLRLVPATDRVGRSVLTVKLRDGRNQASTQFTVDVIRPTLPPVASADNFSYKPGRPQKVSVLDVLNNDVDPNGLPLTVTDVTSPSGRGASVSLLGRWIFYVPSDDTAQIDSFSYTVSNGRASTVGNIRMTPDVSGGTAPGANQLSASIAANGVVHLEFQGIPGRTYDVQYSTQLNAPVWITLGSQAADVNGSLQLDDTTASGGGSRFYRTTEHVP